MAGEARTASFVLQTATVMIGPQASLWNLNPTMNSIGLVKNFSVSATPNYVELTQGVKGSIIYSVMTANPVKATMEVFEYTARNISFALGYEGDALVAPAVTYPTTVALVGSTTTPVTSLTMTAATDPSANFPIGTWIQIQDPVNLDNVMFAKISATPTWLSGVSTLTFTAQGLVTGSNFPVGAIVSLVNTVDVGSKVDQPYMSAKVVSLLPDGERAIGILFPKIRITKGFTLAFSSDKFGDMPYEFSPYELLPADPFYTEFANRGMARLLING